MKKLLLVATAALLTLPAAFAQHIYVNIDPPPIVVEHPGPRPHPGWMWVDGHHRWDGHRYIWVHGFWANPPRPGAVWIKGHWQRDPGGWYWIDGHWA
jgi:hypothetical protein